MRKIVSGIMLTLLVTSMLVTVIKIQPVAAYKSGANSTHDFIFDQAQTILRNDGYVSYADFLDSVDPVDPYHRTYLQLMKAGSNDNDKTEQAREHYHDPMGHNGIYLGFPLFYCKSAAQLCQELFDEAVSKGLSGDYYNAIYTLGWAAHMVQDLCVPQHAMTSAQDYHSEYETWVNDNKNGFAVYSDGIYFFSSFPDYQYYITGDGQHYSWDGVSAYDWVDHNAHESDKYSLSVDGVSLVYKSDYDPDGELGGYIPYVETIHSLPNNLETTFKITKHQASYMRLYFEKLDLQSNVDFVRIYDGNDNFLGSYTGVHNGFWTPYYNCEGTLKIKVTTDGSVQSWGYKVHTIEYYDTGEDLNGATEALLPLAQRTTAGFIKFFFDKVLNPIYIRSDGSVDPSTVPIQRNGNVYTFTSNIYRPIVIERDNITVNGDGRILQGLYNAGDGFYLSNRSGVTIQNLTVNGFWSALFMWNSSNVRFTSNTLENNWNGIMLHNFSNKNLFSGNRIALNPISFESTSILLHSSSNNSIVRNNITADYLPFQEGTCLAINAAFNNIIMENNITSNGVGIKLLSSNSNVLSGNNIAASLGVSVSNSYSNTIIENKIESFYYCISLYDDSLNNMFYHNSIGPSWYQVQCLSTSTWDNGYPSGGNYWSDYNGTDLHHGPYQNETGSDGMGDAPYVIDLNNQDNYPLMRPYVPFENQTIYIRADGSVDPSGAPIHRAGDLYTLTDNITSNANGIVVERNNMTLDGAGYTVQGTGGGNGLTLSGRNKVTIKNTIVRAFYYGIWLSGSSNNSISGNTITANNWDGITLYGSSNHNSVSGNKVTANNYNGIALDHSSNNSVSGNKVTANSKDGIGLGNYSDFNSIVGNTITANKEDGIPIGVSSNFNSIVENTITGNNQNGIDLYYSSDNRFYHNNFINNTRQVLSQGSVNVWDDGYPSGGNYWSDYDGKDLCHGSYQNETGSDGIGDISYVIDTSNRDNYPLMKPYPWASHDIGITSVTASRSVVGHGYNTTINVMAFNYGNYTESINIKIYASETIIGEINDIEILNRSFTIVSFEWNTSGFATGTYTISAYVEPVPGETDIVDNRFVNGIVKIFLLEGPYYTWYGAEYWIVEIGKHPIRLVSNY